MSAASDRASASLDRLTDSVDRLTTAFTAAGTGTVDNDPVFTTLADRADALSDKIDAVVPPVPVPAPAG